MNLWCSTSGITLVRTQSFQPHPLVLVGPIGAEIAREIMNAVRIETVIDILFDHEGGHRHDGLVSREKLQPRALSMIIAPHRQGIQTTTTVWIIVKKTLRAKTPLARVDLRKRE